MPDSSAIGEVFDRITQTILDLGGSEYINFGYWDKAGLTLPEAQREFVDRFGVLGKLDPNSEVLDIGFGTGEQDCYFHDRFKCRSIAGINVSKIQVEMALKKIQKNKKYAGRIVFQWGDALRLREFVSNIYSHVLALESAQLFLDRKMFLEGAHHVLKPGGYHCLAEPILKNESALVYEKFPDIGGELKGETALKDRYGAQLDRALRLNLEEEIRVMKTHPYYGLFYGPYLDLLKSIPFTIEEVQDITRFVLPFYLDLRRRIINFWKMHPCGDPRGELLVKLFAIFYMRYITFKNNSAGYYLIRAKKI